MTFGSQLHIKRKFGTSSIVDRNMMNELHLGDFAPLKKMKKKKQKKQPAESNFVDWECGNPKIQFDINFCL